MKYFRYWVKEPFDIQVGNVVERINILAGSNKSKEDAHDQAVQRSRFIEQRISKRENKKEYDAPIREHVAEILDDRNIITVCRYGAKILNTTQYTILDLDDYAFNFFDLFKAIRKLPKKERIVQKFLQRIEEFPELGRDFRIYETSKGVRVIGKKYIDPNGANYELMMRKLAVDWLYIVLSQKQNCYRARISPKPYRTRIETIKVRSPLDCETEQYREWAEIYERASENYQVVKHVLSLGKDFSADPVIRMHDSVCKAFDDKTLA